MKTTIAWSGLCLVIATIISLAFNAGVKAQTLATANIAQGKVLMVQGVIITGDPPKTWLTVEAHNGQYFTERGFDPSLTRVLSNYKPLFRKLPTGQWEIMFTSELAENLP